MPDIPRNNLNIEVRNGDAVSPKDKVAWKVGSVDTSYRTTVIDVEWNVSANGLIKPRVLYEPITIPGATLSYATGFNAKFIFDNGIGKGSVIMVKRSGDVIPYITSVVSPAETTSKPDIDYKIVGVEAVATEVGQQQLIAALVKSLNALGAENVGPATTANLYKAGFTSIKLIYEASPKDFEKKVERVGPKSAAKIYEGLRAGKDTWSELTFMLASTSFLSFVGKTKLKVLLDTWPNVEEWDYATITAKRPTGISNDTIAEIINALPSYFEWYDENIKDILVVPGEEVEQRPVAAEGAQEAALLALPRKHNIKQ